VRLSTKEENSVKGNLAIHYDIFITRITSSTTQTPTDDVRENTRRLIYNLLYVAEVTRAISAGDFGRVEDLLGNLAMMFRGAGSKKYCTEILYFTYNLKKVWKGDGFEYILQSFPVSIFDEFQ
jgi:hypothetical protein